jgi:hypothetical protein
LKRVRIDFYDGKFSDFKNDKRSRELTIVYDYLPESDNVIKYFDYFFSNLNDNGFYFYILLELCDVMYFVLFSIFF